MSSDGPLTGVRVIEFAGIGPGPHCAMLLADLGAEVLRIDRAGGNGCPNPVVDRGRSVLTVDIRSGAGRCATLAARADVLIEGFRPGVMETNGARCSTPRTPVPPRCSASTKCRSIRTCRRAGSTSASLAGLTPPTFPPTSIRRRRHLAVHRGPPHQKAQRNQQHAEPPRQIEKIE